MRPAAAGGSGFPAPPGVQSVLLSVSGIGLAPGVDDHSGQPQTVATTVPVPGCPGSFAYPVLVLTTTMRVVLPLICDPDLEVELATITPM